MYPFPNMFKYLTVDFLVSGGECRVLVVPQIVYKEVGEIVISGGILRDNM
jgi:hypothetical protein